jgi:hypothetical protein
MKPSVLDRVHIACPPWAAAARFIASTASRLSCDSEEHRTDRPAGWERVGGMFVNVRHLALQSARIA